MIARREGIIERHVRLLFPLAFVSPRILSALLDGTAPAILTATTLARALPRSWAEQERRHLRQDCSRNVDPSNWEQARYFALDVFGKGKHAGAD